MKYSLIITYRDRKKHLSQLLPVLQKKFMNHDYEIIISEQDDKKKFRKNDLYNIAVREYATGDVLVFHDVDYVPDDSVTYEIKDQPEMWEEIGGLNPLYVGWGLEDDDTRQRVRAWGYEWFRPEPEVGTFFVLPHDDNHPGIDDESYLKNVEIAKDFENKLKYGYKDSKGVVEKFETNNENLIWLKIR